MNVTLKSFATIRDAIGSSTITIGLAPGSTLADLFDCLSGRYGDSFDRQVRDKTSGALVPFLILVNSETYRSIADMGTPLNDGDMVTIMIPFDGG